MVVPITFERLQNIEEYNTLLLPNGLATFENEQMEGMDLRWYSSSIPNNKVPTSLGRWSCNFTLPYYTVAFDSLSFYPYFELEKRALRKVQISADIH